MTQIDEILLKLASYPEEQITDLTVESVRKKDIEVQLYQNPLEDVGGKTKYIANTEVGNIPIQVFSPINSNLKKSLPVLIFFHGGGFVIGSESYEAPIRELTNRSNCIVCLIEYSLAPEYKFPKAINQAIAATKWLVNNINLFNGNKNNIAIGGDSSGGNLAVIVALENQKNKIHNFKCLILIYPMLDATCSLPSINEFGSGYGFTKEKINWYFDQYIPNDVDKKHENISPFFSDNLKGFPNTFIATAEYDPLRDEAEFFACKLIKSGVQVSSKRYPKMIHGFFQMSGKLNEGKILINNISEYLKLSFKN